MSWDTLSYVLVTIWNLPRPSETLFEIGDVDHGVRHTPKCTNLVHLGPRLTSWWALMTPQTFLVVVRSPQGLCRCIYTKNE